MILPPNHIGAVQIRQGGMTLPIRYADSRDLHARVQNTPAQIAPKPGIAAGSTLRVAAIVLAAGASTRMNGRVKQLLLWRGKRLIENAVDLALQSHAHETIVVLGAHADVIRPVIEKTTARLVINPQWADGQATSIRAGLNALAPEIAAAVFINADQPLLTHAVVDAIIQRYRETAAPIITSVFAGNRGSPVLFDRAYFAELKNLHGEQGGRELLAKYPVARVEFTDARLGIDIDTWEEYANLKSD